MQESEMMSEDEIRADLERVLAVRDTFDPGEPGWLVNQGMALAYQNVLNEAGGRGDE